MKRYFSKLIRTLTLTLTLTIFFLTSRAQNTGPTAPEAMSFEPVDVSDMVNLSTGDMTYVIPIITVPGPEGGYPIGLSYHGGVAVDQEASWVGLGWNINPGAINRTISGFPDDWDGKNYFEYIYNPGGIDITNSFGLYFPLTLMSGGTLPSFGVNYSWGATRGFGGSISYGISKTFSVGMDINPNGSIGLNASIGFKNSPVSIGVGITFDAESYAIQANVGEGDLVLNPTLGISYASKGGVSVGASAGSLINFKHFSSFASQNDWSVTQSSRSTDLWLVSWGKTTVKYWLFKQEIKNAFGSVYTNIAYAGDESDPTLQSRYNVMDVHSLDRDYNNFIDPEDAILNENLLLPSPDSYSISAQGISGDMSPRYEDVYNLVNETFINTDDSKECKYSKTFGSGMNNHVLSEDSNPRPFNVNALPNFYFGSENASDYQVHDVNIDSESDAEDISSSYDYSRKADLNCYNLKNDRQVTGNYVEWFTNEAILSAEQGLNNNAYKRGFVETSALEMWEQKELDGLFTIKIYPRTSLPQKGIGAFSITTSEGMTYHYSLPVYQYEEFLRAYDKTTKEAYQEQRRIEPYASTWLLTAITGPDYIDRGGSNGAPNGKIDQNDLGYWVQFNYGKWTDGYVWQLPAVNPNKELPYHIGRKQIYYLNTIKTRSHTAYFIKSLRTDGKGAGISSFDLLTGYHLITDVNIHRAADAYTFHKTEAINDVFNLNVGEHPVLKLDKIILTSNDKPELHAQLGDGVLIGSMKSDYIYNWKETILGIERSADHGRTLMDVQFLGQYNKNVLFDYTSAYDNNAIRIIDFNYDYSLNGKLSLKSLFLKGKGGSNIMPPYVFSYINKSYSGKDNWGFNIQNTDYKGDDFPKPSVDNWSLNSILTPIGTQINVNYESDTYVKEAVLNGNVKHKGKFDARIIERNPLYIKFSIGVITPPISEILIRGHLNVGYSEIPIVDDRKNRDFKVKLYSPTVESYDPSMGTAVLKLMFNLHQEVDDITDKDFGYEYVNSFTIEDIVYQSNEQSSEKYGGGLRVKSIKTFDPISARSYETEYTYRNGQTSYAPRDFDFYIPYFSEIPGPGVIYSEVEVKNKVNGKYADDITTCHFNNYDDKINVSQDQFSRELAGNSNSNPKAWFCAVKKDYTKGSKRTTNTVEIIDALGLRGTLDEKIVKNQQGQVLSHIKNYYRKGNEIQQSFLTSKKTTKSGTTSNFSFCTSKSTQNFVLDKVEEIVNDRKSVTEYLEYDPNSGSVLKTRTIKANNDEVENSVVPAFVKYQAMGSKVWDINNKNMLVQPTANYTWYKKEGGTKNLLGANVQTWYGYWGYRIFDASENKYYDAYWGGNEIKDGKYQLFYSNFKVFSLPETWRKYQSWEWHGDINPDGSFKGFESKDFNWSWTRTNIDNINQDNGWVKTNEITRYNNYSAPLESKDINGKFSATRMGYNNTLVIASASNASYNSFAYTGFEFEENLSASSIDYGSEFMGTSTGITRILDNNQLTVHPHTGSYYLQMTTQQSPTFTINISEYFEFLDGRKYRASVWLQNTSPNTAELVVLLNKADGTHKEFKKAKNAPDNKKFGDWVLVNLFIEDAIFFKDQLQVFVRNTAGGTVYIDDIRIQPVDASVTAYTYNDANNVSAILNNDNFAVKYDYDAGGRLIATYKETPNGFKKVSENNHKYARSNNVIDFDLPPSPVFPGIVTHLTALDAGTGAKYQWVTDGVATPTVPSVGYKTLDWTFSSGSSQIKLNVVEADGKSSSVTKTLDVIGLKVLSPLAGNTIQKGSTIVIQWDISPLGSLSGYFKVEICNINTGTRMYLGTSSSNQLEWQIPFNFVTTATDFKVIVTHVASGLSAESGEFPIE